MFFHNDNKRDSPDLGVMESCFKTVSHAFEIAMLFSDSQRLFRSIPESQEIYIPMKLRYRQTSEKEVFVDFQSANKEYNTDQSNMIVRHIKRLTSKRHRIAILIPLLPMMKTV